MDYELTKRYFKTVSEKVDAKINWGLSIGLIVGGFLACILFIGSVTFLGIIGIIAAVVGVVLIVVGKSKIATEKERIEKEKASIPSDEQYDNEVLKKLYGLEEMALNELGVDRDEVSEIEPISFEGYVYKGADQAKKGKDSLWRTNKYEYVILFFSQNEVHCFTYDFDTTRDNVHHSTELYFYKDIVSANTDHETVKILGENVDYDYFKLTTAGGTALSVSLKDVNNAQRSINAMRTLLRAKKQA